MASTRSADTAETQALLASLDDQRRHVVGIMAGLSDAALRRPVLPSGWNLLGLMNHLALDDERFWFRGIVAGERDVIDAVNAGTPDAWQVGAETTPDEVFERYRREATVSNEIIVGTSLDAPLAWWPDELFPKRWLQSVRDVVLHAITETACHAGHADAARELIDGTQCTVVRA